MRKPIQLTFKRPTPEELGEIYGISKERQAELLEIWRRPVPRKSDTDWTSEAALRQPSLAESGADVVDRSL